jgi:hypothetical protein
LVLPETVRIAVLALLAAALLACDGSMQTVSINAEDFRFTPDLVRVKASAPLTLTVYNAGREVHEFDSPILMYAANLNHMAVMGENESPVEVHLTKN